MRIASQMWDALRAHLLADNREQLAFILATRGSGRDTHVMVACELICVPESALKQVSHGHGLSLGLDGLLESMNRASRGGMFLVEAHSHPFEDESVEFSGIDQAGQQELAEYLSDVPPGKPYGALVLGQRSVAGQVWLSDRSRPVPLEEVVVVGNGLRRVRVAAPSGPRSIEKLEEALGGPDEFHHRQILVFGREGQEKVGRTGVGIVGLGGIGSVVAQQLAYLGAGRFVLIDDDRVDRTNLNRLVGATPTDVGKPKVEVARRQILAVNAAADVLSIDATLRSPEALRALLDVDVVFGCLDTDAARLILNEFAVAYLLPYLDCGVGIIVEKGRVQGAGGKVSVWVPERPCLLCAKDINPRIAAEELEGEQERRFRRQQSYIEGIHVPEPAVISLNSTVASLAVTEFLCLVTDLRETQQYTYYDLLEGKAGARRVAKDKRCTVCPLLGHGHRANVERYSKQGLPADLPTSS